MNIVLCLEDDDKGKASASRVTPILGIKAETICDEDRVNEFADILWDFDFLEKGGADWIDARDLRIFGPINELRVNIEGVQNEFVH